MRNSVNSPQPGDKVTLWYQNQSFVSPAISTSHTTTDQAMWWQGNAAYNHWVRIGSATYSCLEDSLNSAGVAGNIAAQINASDPNCTATTGGTYGNEIFTLKTGVAGSVAVSSSDGSAPDSLSQVSAATILQSIAQREPPFSSLAIRSRLDRSLPLRPFESLADGNFQLR